MHKRKLLVGMVMMFSLLCSANVIQTTQTIYINQIKDLAIREMLRTDIPASVTIAQAIMESSWGNGHLAKASNNYFGIKCKSTWTGDRVYSQDDDYDQEGNLLASCFRSYENIAASFIDHSDFLVNNERYASLFIIKNNDYKIWAQTLKDCGYATDPDYAEKLIKLIETYNLTQFDAKSVQVLDAPGFEVGIGMITASIDNDVQFVQESTQEISHSTEIMPEVLEPAPAETPSVIVEKINNAKQKNDLIVKECINNVRKLSRSARSTNQERL